MRLRTVTLAAVVALAMASSAFAAPSGISTAAQNLTPGQGGQSAFFTYSFDVAKTGAYTFAESWASILTPTVNGIFGASIQTQGNNPVSLYDLTKFANTAATSASEVVQLTAGHYDLVLLAARFSMSTYTVQGFKASVTPVAVAVPGPEAGAGIGALTMGGIALFVKRRRKTDVAAA